MKMVLLWKLLLLHPFIGASVDSSLLRGPSFTKQPGSIVFPLRSTDSNQEVVFSCEAQGHPPPSYRWKQNETLIIPKAGSRYSIFGGNLRISHLVKEEDEGTYQCLASNSFGTIISRKAKLSIAYLENFKTQKRSSVLVREGQGVVLLCGPPAHSGGGEGVCYHGSRRSHLSDRDPEPVHMPWSA